MDEAFSLGWIGNRLWNEILDRTTWRELKKGEQYQTESDDHRQCLADPTSDV
jgi:hypothetical protein